MSLKPQSGGQQGLLFVLSAVVGYSFLPIFVSYLRADGVQPITIAFWRFLITAGTFWLIVLLRRGALVEKMPRAGLFVMGVSMVIQSLAALIGLQYLSPGIYLVLYYTYPAIVALLSLFLGERLSRIGWAALALTLVGVVLTAADFVSIGSELTFDRDQGIGALCAFVNAAGTAVYFIVINRLMRGRRDTVKASAWMITGAVVVLTIFTLGQALTGLGNDTTQLAIPQGVTWLHLIGLIFVSTVFPVFMLNKGIQLAGSTRAAIFGTIEPLLVAVLSLIVLNQGMQPIQWVGGALVVMSVILLQLSGTSAATDAETVADPSAPLSVEAKG